MKVKVLVVQVLLFTLMVASATIGTHRLVMAFSTISTGTDQDSRMTVEMVAILEGDVLARPRQAKDRVNPRLTGCLADNKVREATAVRMRENSCKSVNARFSIEDSTGEAVISITV